MQAQQSAVSPSFDLDEFIPYFEKSMQEGLDIWQAPGVAVAIIVDGKVAYLKGFGVTELNNPQPVTEHTVFPVASTSKPFTAVLAMIMADQGTINLDSLVSDYLPDIKIGMQNVEKKLTVRQLMMHCSGLPHFSGDTITYVAESAEEILKAMAYMPQKAMVGEEFGYQNILFGILGMCLEKASGKKFDDLMVEHIIKPLNLAETYCGPEVAQPQSWLQKMFGKLFGQVGPVVAQPHDVWEGKTNQLAFHKGFYFFSGSTGINSSAHDIGVWLEACIDQFSSQPKWRIPNFAKMIQPLTFDQRSNDNIYFTSDRIRDVGYGMGWYSYNYEGLKLVGHQGGLRGTRSLVTFSPDKRIGLVILSNFGGMRVSAMPEAIRNIFFDYYLKLPQVNWHRELHERSQERLKKYQEKMNIRHTRLPMPSQPLSYYVGTYQHDIYGTIDVKEAGKSLVLNFKDKKIPLQHVNGNVYKFSAKDLSDFFSGVETPAYIEWGGPRREKADMCDIYALFEGKDPFVRIK